MWHSFVSGLEALLFVLTQLFHGNLGLAILTFSLMVRLALLPLTLQVALRARAQQKIFEQLRPELLRLQEAHRDDAVKLHHEVAKLYRRYGYAPFDARSLLTALLQVPLGMGLYASILRGLAAGGSFLWLNLARPDFVLTLLVAGLSYLGTALNPDLSLQIRASMALISAMITLFLLANLPSGLGLYWGASSAVGLLQTVLLRKNHLR